MRGIGEFENLLSNLFLVKIKSQLFNLSDRDERLQSFDVLMLRRVVQVNCGAQKNVPGFSNSQNDGLKEKGFGAC